MEMAIWMETTLDKYELPVAVADTAAELAKLRGVSVDTIRAKVSKAKNGTGTIKRSRFVKVEFDDTDMEEGDED